MSEKKLAIVLRGISYYDGVETVCNSKIVDFSKCIASFKFNLILPLKKLFPIIDIFLLTYYNDKILEILTGYAPKDVRLYSKQELFSRNSKEITATLLLDSLELVETYSARNKVKYDNICILRFDMYFPFPLPLERLKIDKFNFGWVGTYGQYDDCFHFFSPKHILAIKTYIPYHDMHGYMHGLNYAFNQSEINYLCRRGCSSVDYFPDFYFFQRQLPDYCQGKMQIVFPEDMPNWTVIDPAVKHLVLITTCINIDRTPLYNNVKRSVFSPQERLDQALESIKSVRDRIPNTTIVLVNNNQLEPTQLKQLSALCDHVIIYQDYQINDITFTAEQAKTFPNSSAIETAALLFALDYIESKQLEYNYFWKLTGRYKIMPRFELNKWLNSDIVVVPPRQSGDTPINTTFYCMKKSLVPMYRDLLKQCFIQCYNNLALSQDSTLFNYDQLKFITHIAYLFGARSNSEDRIVLIT